MATGNEYRKVRALLAKTVKAGCTEGEAVSALETALKLIDQYKLDRSKLEITVPEGYRLVGSKAGETLRVEKVEAKAKPSKPSQPKETGSKPRKATGEYRAGTAAAKVVDAMRSPAGMDAKAMQAELGVLPHTLRGMISHAKKRLGLTITLKDGIYRAN